MGRRRKRPTAAALSTSLERRPVGRSRRRQRARRSRGLVALLLLATLALAGYLFLQPAEPPPAATAPPVTGILRVHYVDVGQGDGTIWELPDGSIVVYDCGPAVANVSASPMVRHLRDALRRPEGSTIAAVIASHGHLDHVGGCDEVFEAYRVEHVYEAWYEGEDAPTSYRRFQDAIRAENATLHRFPDTLAPGSLALPSAKAEILWPRAFPPSSWDRIAERSLVVRVQHGATTFCFQGDIEARQEAELAARCDVYLVGHHGSRHASSAEWLARMGPSLAIVSSGENPYGHPTDEALCRVQQTGALLALTSESGTIIVESDGASVRIAQGEPDATDRCADPVSATNATAGDDG